LRSLTKFHYPDNLFSELEIRRRESQVTMRSSRLIVHFLMMSVFDYCFLLLSALLAQNARLLDQIVKGCRMGHDIELYQDTFHWKPTASRQKLHSRASRIIRLANEFNGCKCTLCLIKSQSNNMTWYRNPDQTSPYSGNSRMNTTETCFRKRRNLFYRIQCT
jgi:hypothetical protein